MMIIDTVSNFKKYTSIPHIDTIISFLNNTDISALPPGDIPIQGKELYVKVLRYIPKKAVKNDFEIHSVYTDVQVIVSGAEMMQLAPLDSLHKKTEYDSEGDFQFFTGDKHISEIIMQKGQFIVFFPQESHKPGCFYQDTDSPVMKLVFKTKQYDTFN